MAALLLNSMRNNSAVKRLLALQRTADLAGIQTIPQWYSGKEYHHVPRSVTERSPNFFLHALQYMDYRAFSIAPSLAASTRHGQGDSEPTHFHRILQHPSVEHGSGTSSFPEGEHEEPEDDGDDEDAPAQQLRERLLKAALGHVKEKGWSVAALQSGADDLQLSKAASGLVSNGAAGLVEYFVDDCNQKLAAEMESRQEEVAGLRVPERIRMALRMRLEMLVPYIDTWPQALAIQAHPAHAAIALQQRAELVDNIWHACGDTSTDYNWYTKRGLLAAVYAATELFILTDYSPGYADTWRALDRRLADVKRLGGAATEVRQAFNSLLANVGSMAEWAQDVVIQAQKRRQQ